VVPANQAIGSCAALASSRPSDRKNRAENEKVLIISIRLGLAAGDVRQAVSLQYGCLR
jgi:hypothetical protein